MSGKLCESLKEFFSGQREGNKAVRAIVNPVSSSPCVTSDGTKEVFVAPYCNLRHTWKALKVKLLSPGETPAFILTKLSSTQPQVCLLEKKN